MMTRQRYFEFRNAYRGFSKWALRYFLFATLLVAITSLRTAAQSATATLSGTVEDQNGAVVPGANITVTNTSTSLERKITTNEQGQFSVPLLPPSMYSVRVEAQGFSPVQVEKVILNVGDQKSLQIQLKTGSISEMVQINADAPLISESPAVGTVVDRQFVENIPLNGRSFQSLITLTPGVQIAPSSLGKGQFSVNGQRPSANAFTIDGVSANFGVAVGNPYGAQSGGNLPSFTAFGTTQNLVSVDALQEFKVETSGSTAEYGRQPGGQLSIVTRSGSNEFHGSIFDYVRNDKLDANDWFANRAGQPRPPERQNDFGGTLSGPVLLPRFGEGGHQPWYNGRNRTFFFFSDEQLRLRLPKFVLTNVPTLSLRQAAPSSVQPILNAFPIPNGRDLGNGLAEFSAAYSEPSNLDAISVRIDHSINGRITAFGRYSYAPSERVIRVSGNLSTIQFQKLKTETITLGATISFTSNLSNQFRLNLSRNDGTFGLVPGNFGGAVPVPRSILIPSQFDTDIDAVQGSALLQFSGSFSTISVLPGSVFSQRQVNLVDSVLWQLNAHQLKAGFDYRRLTPDTAVNKYALFVTFTSMQQVLNATAGSGLILSNVKFSPIYDGWSAFLQDTWKTSPRLTLDFGLRWEVNPPPGESHGLIPWTITQIKNLATMQLAPVGTKLWKTTYGNVAPRVGIAYRLSQNAETIIRGGVGVYYDTGNEFSSSPFFNSPFFLMRTLSNVRFPLSPMQVAPPSVPGPNPPFGTLSVFDPELKLPYTIEWNVAIQRSLGKSQSVTASYVGAAGRRLLQQQQLVLNSINPNFTTVLLNTNHATSDYDAIQAQFQRRLSRGLQALTSYTWSHSIDEDSAGNTARATKRGNSDFDVRHNFAAAVTYDLPVMRLGSPIDAVLNHWSIDSTVHAQSAFPVDLIARTLIDSATGSTINVRPDVIAGVPLYVSGPTFPGGRRINRAAFSIPATEQSGTLGRNVLQGLPAWQVDLALRREINLTEKLKLQLRGEAFNIFNHPNFGTIQTTLAAVNFGEATNMLNRQLGGLSQLYQIGGPRSFQLAAKVLF